MRVLCPYCGGAAALTIGRDMPFAGSAKGGRDGQWFWYCKPCYSWVGCHPQSQRPLGTLANQSTRVARATVHKLFDPIWKSQVDRGLRGARDKAYRWFAHEMGLTKDQCHIGMFSYDQCIKAIHILEKHHKRRPV